MSAPLSVLPLFATCWLLLAKAAQGGAPSASDPLAIAPTLAEVAVVAASYLLGSIPFGFVLSKLLKGVDLRSIGSGNIGATNAMRVLGKPLGVLVFLLDAAKGAAAILVLVPLVARPEAATQTAVLCGTAAVLGHCFSVFLGFSGGKGVATGLGALLTFDPLVVVGGVLVWLVVLATTRWVALASVAMGLAFPVLAWWRLAATRPAVVVAAGLLGVLILVRHRSNMGRMLAGTEPKVFTRHADAAAAPSGVGEGGADR